MMLLTVGISFVIFILNLLIGIGIGYSIGYKNEKTLRQQVSKLKLIVRKHNKSAQLKELTAKELAGRDDWDFRKKLAEVTNSDITTPDLRKDDDPSAMSNMF